MMADFDVQSSVRLSVSEVVLKQEFYSSGLCLAAGREQEQRLKRFARDHLKSEEHGKAFQSITSHLPRSDLGVRCVPSKESNNKEGNNKDSSEKVEREKSEVTEVEAVRGTEASAAERSQNSASSMMNNFNAISILLLYLIYKNIPVY